MLPPGEHSWAASVFALIRFRLKLTPAEHGWGGPVHIRPLSWAVRRQNEVGDLVLYGTRAEITFSFVNANNERSP